MIYFVYNKADGSLITTIAYVEDLKYFNPELVSIVTYI
jgi:hypothetical protein